MRDQLKVRSVTFTGCWTCKERKVRCDERPLACGNCEKRGLVCGGYGIKLHWPSSPLAPNETSRGQGRRRIKLDRTSCPQYSSKQIDGFLSTIDNDEQSNVPLRMGPFSKFAVRTAHHDHQEVSKTPSPMIPVHAEKAQNVGNSRIYDMPEDNGHFDSIPLNTCCEPEEHSSICRRRALHSAAYGVAYLPLSMQHPLSSLSEDTDVNMLMHHYIVNVADLIQPIRYHRNTYRDLYAPTALQGVDISTSDLQNTSRKADSALFHALLASAAFHLWNCNRALTKFQRMGNQHRTQALHLLQSAVNSPILGPDYRSLMMAMLALVTIGLMSGEVEDFAVHLSGAVQLRNWRRRWKVIGVLTRQMNEISAFLILLARTLSFQSPQSLWIGTDGDISYSENSLAEMVQPGHCYTYMYGITPKIAAAIQETCRLSELLAQSNGDPNYNTDPALLDQCEALGDRLLSWSLESDNAALTLTGDEKMSKIFEYYVKTWHCAALIYYYHRIQRYSAEDLVKEVEWVAEHMNMIEDIKATSKCEMINRIAPVTWPIFIASCVTMTSRRDSCRKWWERVQHYGIATLGRQWDAVMMIWQKQDEMRQEDLAKTSWMDIYCQLEINLLPL